MTLIFEVFLMWVLYYVGYAPFGLTPRLHYRNGRCSYH